MGRAERRLYKMLVALVLVGVVMQPASSSTVDLAEIQGTVVPGGKEMRGVVDPGASSYPTEILRSRRIYRRHVTL